MPQFDTALAHHRLAYRTDGPDTDMAQTGIFWLGGLKSDMTGSKAAALAAMARATRRNCLRFDYSGHGASSGAFEDGTISLWLDQAVHMFISHTTGRRVVVGSSMGGWLALLLARALSREDPAHFRRIAGLVLIAPATDMTEALMWEQFPFSVRQTILERGHWDLPSDYGGGYHITAQLIEDGRRHLLFQDGLALPFPVRIIQGGEDKDVPPDHAVRTFEMLTGPDVTLTYIKGGDHRLSTPTQLAIIKETVNSLCERSDGISP
jgi:pimeloyl-ACP methyl ester carboxylesterase